MPKGSSAKKVQRAQRAGSTRVAGQRRNLGFPLLIVGIIVVGTALVALARSQAVDAASEAPTVGQHWHAAYGVFICDAYIPAPFDGPTDVNGIHTHALPDGSEGDGLIHIHPFNSVGAGKNARMGVFFDQIGMEVTDDRIVLPDGTEYANGDDCTIGEGEAATTEPGELRILRWPPRSTDRTEPEEITSGFREVPFDEDGEGFSIVFAPEGADIPLPPAFAEIEERGAIDGGDIDAGVEDGGPDGPATSAPSTSAPATTAPEAGGGEPSEGGEPSGGGAGGGTTTVPPSGG